MKDFDYETAWKLLARPAFDALPQNVRDLYDRVCVEMKDARQNPHDLGVDFPAVDVSDLETRFAEIPSEILAAASQIIHDYGHWGGSWAIKDNTGGHWKFAKLADRELAERIGLKTDTRTVRNGRGFVVIEGLIRVCFSTNDHWTWEEITLATPYNWSMISQLAWPSFPGSSPRARAEEWVDRSVEVAKAAKHDLWPKAGFISHFRDIARFMRESCDKCHRSGWVMAPGPPCGACGQPFPQWERVACPTCAGTKYVEPAVAVL